MDKHLTRDDDVCLHMLAGANFGPGAKLVLPSGTEMGGDEAQALSSSYAPAVGEVCEDDVMDDYELERIYNNRDYWLIKHDPRKWSGEESQEQISVDPPQVKRPWWKIW